MSRLRLWWKRLAPIRWGIWRVLWPSAIALGLVYLLRWIGWVKPDEKIYTAWVVTSGFVMGLVNSVFREQKRIDDVDRHDRNREEIRAVQRLVTLLHDELCSRGAVADVGLKPIVPPEEPNAKK